MSFQIIVNLTCSVSYLNLVYVFYVYYIFICFSIALMPFTFVDNPIFVRTPYEIN